MCEDIKPESEVSKESKNHEDLSDFATKELTKASISQAIGTLLYPITSELAAAEVHGINKLKHYIKHRNKQKIAQKSKSTIKAILNEASENPDDPEKLRKIEKIYNIIERASNQELENEQVSKLWDSIISRIREGDSDIDLLVTKLESLSTAEAEFLLEFYSGMHKNINVNPFFTSISFKTNFDKKHERFHDLAMSLNEKGILTQPFPVLKLAFSLLFPILFFLLFAEFFRENFSNMNINVSSANNVILMGVLGVIIGLTSIPIVKQKTELTWLGEKLCKGIVFTTKI